MRRGYENGKEKELFPDRERGFKSHPRYSPPYRVGVTIIVTSDSGVHGIGHVFYIILIFSSKGLFTSLEPLG